VSLKTDTVKEIEKEIIRSQTRHQAVTVTDLQTRIWQQQTAKYSFQQGNKPQFRLRQRIFNL